MCPGDERARGRAQVRERRGDRGCMSCLVTRGLGNPAAASLRCRENHRRLVEDERRVVVPVDVTRLEHTELQVRKRGAELHLARARVLEALDVATRKAVHDHVLVLWVTVDRPVERRVRVGRLVGNVGATACHVGSGADPPRLCARYDANGASRPHQRSSVATQTCGGNRNTPHLKGSGHART